MILLSINRRMFLFLNLDTWLWQLNSKMAPTKQFWPEHVCMFLLTRLWSMQCVVILRQHPLKLEPAGLRCFLQVEYSRSVCCWTDEDFDVNRWKISNTTALSIRGNHGKIHLLCTFYDRCTKASFAHGYHGPINTSATSGRVDYQLHFVQEDIWGLYSYIRRGLRPIVLDADISCFFDKPRKIQGFDIIVGRGSRPGEDVGHAGWSGSFRWFQRKPMGISSS